MGPDAASALESRLPDADSVVVRVPERALLSVHTVKMYPEFQAAIREQGCQLLERVILSSLLLWLCATNSQGASSWGPYLKVLPTEYTILGAFCEELEDEFQARFALSTIE